MLTDEVNKRVLEVIINNEEEYILKTVMMLRVMEVIYNNRLNKQARIRTVNDMMFLDLIILQKLSRIFMTVIWINYKFKQELEVKKEIDLLKRPCI